MPIKEEEEEVNFSRSKNLIVKSTMFPNCYLYKNTET